MQEISKDPSADLLWIEGESLLVCLRPGQGDLAQGESCVLADVPRTCFQAPLLGAALLCKATCGYASSITATQCIWANEDPCRASCPRVVCLIA